MNIRTRRFDTWQEPESGDYYHGKIVVADATETGKMTGDKVFVALSKHLDLNYANWKLILSQPSKKRIVSELL